MILQLAFCSYLNALHRHLSLPFHCDGALHVSARSKLLLDGNRATPMQRGDRPLSSHASASGSRRTCIFRAGMISMPACRRP